MVFKKWRSTIHKLQKLLELRSQNDVELHVEEVKKIGNQIKTGDNEYKLSDLGTRKNEIIEELKNLEYNDFEDMAFRMGITYSEIEKTLDMKAIDTSFNGYTVPPGIYEISDNKLMLKNLLPNEVKVNNKIDDKTLKSNLTTNKTNRFTKKSFFLYLILAFVESHSGVLGDIPDFDQLIPGSYKSDKLIIITGIDKVHLK